MEKFDDLTSQSYIVVKFKDLQGYLKKSFKGIWGRISESLPPDASEA